MRWTDGAWNVLGRLLLLTAIALLMTLAIAWVRVSQAAGGDDNSCGGNQSALVMCQGSLDVPGQFDHAITGPPLTVTATHTGS